MADLRADRRAVGLVETTVWVPAGSATEIREWAWSWCEKHLDEAGQRAEYERRRAASLEADREARAEAEAQRRGQQTY